MVKKCKMVYFLLGLIIVFDILYKSDSIYYIPFGLSLALLIGIISFAGGDMRIELSKTYSSKIFIVFILYSLLTCVCSDGMEIQVIKNVMVFSVFFTAIIMLAKFTDDYEKREKMLRIILIATGLVVTIMFFTNEGNINYAVQIRNLLKTSARIRYAYGLGHYNDAGLDAVCIFVVTIIYLNAYKDYCKFLFKLFLGVINIISLFVFLGASCRNAVLGLGLFFCVYILFRTSGRKERKYMYFLQFSAAFLIGIIFVVFLKSYYHTDNLSDLLTLSGRKVAFLGISTMIEDGKQIFGYGLTNKTDFLLYAKKTNNTFIMDSSYVYYIVHSGLVGAVMIASEIMILFVRLMKKKTKNVQQKWLLISATVFFLFTGLFETTVFYAGMPISLIFTLIILQYIINGDGHEI